MSLLTLLLLHAASLAAAAARDVILQTQVPIVHPSSRQELKPIQLFADEEPVDTLETLRLQLRQDRTWRDAILPQLCRQPRVRCRRAVPVVFATAVGDPQGRHLGMLEVLEDQEPIDALVAFSMTHDGIGRDQRVQLLEAVCRQSRAVRCTRNRALMDKQLIRLDDRESTLEIYDDEEPVDQIYRFVVDHALHDAALQQLVDMFCSSRRVPCERTTPLMYSRPILAAADSAGGSQNVGRLVITVDQEPADVVLAFGSQRGLGREFRRELLRQVCADKYVVCNRQDALVFASPIHVDNGTQVGVLAILEDEELADAVYHFAKEANLTGGTRVSLLQTLCGRDGITCTRGQALLKSLPVSNADGKLLGVIHVFEGQEPADVVHDFARQHGLWAGDELTLVETLCGTSKSSSSSSPQERKGKAAIGHRPEIVLACNRYAPVAFAVPVSATNSTRLGVLEVLANEEPADAIARFGNKHGLSADEKLNLWKAICEASGIPCTRSKGLIYRAVYALPNSSSSDGGVVQERLDFMDGDEPTDIIYEYGQLRNLTLRQRKLLLHEVCNEPRKRPNCTRAEPMLVKIPVWESQDKKMGDLEILEGQEPVDVVYAFLEKHDLFQTEPLNTTLLETVCNSTRVTCTRSKPRKILFSMQATYAGVQHSLQYVRPESDWICEQQQHGGQACVHYVEVLAKQFCATHMFDWPGCEPRMLDALRSQLEIYETHMWRGKDLYAKLGLVKSASREEIDAAYNTLVKRFNNETEPYKYEKLKEAYTTLSDPEEKYFYDLPCLKFFGLCGKKKKDGSISISAD